MNVPHTGEDRGGGKDAIWTRIGSAWPHKDGKGFNVQLAALPASGGRIVLREVTEAETVEEEQRSRSTVTESQLSDLARVALAGPGEPELQLAEQVLRTGVRDALSAARRSRRKSSGAA